MLREEEAQKYLFLFAQELQISSLETEKSNFLFKANQTLSRSTMQLLVHYYGPCIFLHPRPPLSNPRGTRRACEDRPNRRALHTSSPLPAPRPLCSVYQPVNKKR